MSFPPNCWFFIMSFSAFFFIATYREHPHCDLSIINYLCYWQVVKLVPSHVIMLTRTYTLSMKMYVVKGNMFQVLHWRSSLQWAMQSHFTRSLSPYQHINYTSCMCTVMLVQFLMMATLYFTQCSQLQFIHLGIQHLEVTKHLPITLVCFSTILYQ